MTKTNVERFPAASNDEADLPPFDIGIAINLAGERQITLRSPVNAPISREEANRRMDGLMKVAERQRSLVEIRLLEPSIADKKDALENVWRKRRAEAEEKHKARVAALEKAVEDGRVRQEEVKQAAAAAWTSRGKRGDFKLEPGDDRRVKAIGQDISAALDKVKTAEAEHLQQLQTIDGNIEKLEAEIRAMERELEQHRAIVG